MVCHYFYGPILGILGAFCVCLPIYLDLVNIFFMKFWADIFANSASHNTEKYYGMLFCSRKLFLFFWASLGNGSLYLVEISIFSHAILYRKSFHYSGHH